MGRLSGRREDKQLSGVPGGRPCGSTSVPESRPSELSRRKLVRALRSAGITERRAGAGSDLLSQPILIVGDTKIYDQDGRQLAKSRLAKSSPSLFKRVLTGAAQVVEVVDVHDQGVLKVEVRAPMYRAIETGGSEIGTIVVQDGWRLPHIIQANGETVGSLKWVNRRTYSVRDAHDVEVGRITHLRESLIRRSIECNVIEFDKGMPDEMRPLMLAATEAVTYLKIPPLPG